MKPQGATKLYFPALSLIRDGVLWMCVHVCIHFDVHLCWYRFAGQTENKVVIS